MLKKFLNVIEAHTRNNLVSRDDTALIKGEVLYHYFAQSNIMISEMEYRIYYIYASKLYKLYRKYEEKNS